MEHGVYHLAAGHVLELRSEFFQELESQKAEFLADQEVIHRLEAAVQTAQQVCYEYNNTLTETTTQLGLREQELLNSEQQHNRAENLVQKAEQQIIEDRTRFSEDEALARNRTQAQAQRCYTGLLDRT